ncbi:hypothetical protein NGRA_1960 [Nosema granulosis]|uniref:Uncharacterized protein n=1 Tax=Nosema granulosis TaxID=83296 RepID=A0A9P6GYJ9_9MICR|nr:hypothetical protein NGRA_1960 [Nosema granulosis]
MHLPIYLFFILDRCAVPFTVSIYDYSHKDISDFLQNLSIDEKNNGDKTIHEIMFEYMNGMHKNNVLNLLNKKQIKEYEEFREKLGGDPFKISNFLRDSFKYILSRKYLHYVAKTKELIAEELFTETFDKLTVSKIVDVLINDLSMDNISEAIKKVIIFEIETLKKRLSYPKDCVELFTRLYVDSLLVGNNSYLYTFSWIISLDKLHSQIRTEKKCGRKKNNNKNPKIALQESNYRDLKATIARELELVSDNDVLYLLRKINPNIKKFDEILNYNNKIKDETTRLHVQSFFKDMILIFNSYRQYMRYKDLESLFDVFKKILNGKISYQDLIPICKVYYLIYQVEDFKDTFFETKTESLHYVNIVKTGTSLNYIIVENSST